MNLFAARWPHNVVRRRQEPGRRNDLGEWEPGQIVRSILPAMTQPASLQDVNLEGGVQLSERLRVYVPVGISRRIVPGDTLRWHGQVLTLHGEALTWGGGTVDVMDAMPLAAAFEDREADSVEVDTRVFAVEESMLWSGDHVRAILLRET